MIMRKQLIIISAVLFTTSLFSQLPQKISYQAVIRDNINQLVISTKLGMQISILKGNANGTPVYVETQSPMTNNYGMISLEIGEGLIQTGTFSSIDWGGDQYFIKTEIDFNGGVNYSISGTSQMLSVPYALYAKTSGSSIPGQKGDKGEQGIAGKDGNDGLSAYQIWLNAGNTGTTSQFLDFLKGIQGVKGDTGAQGAQGAQGIQGIQGLQGLPGATTTTGVKQIIHGSFTITFSNNPVTVTFSPSIVPSKSFVSDLRYAPIGQLGTNMATSTVAVTNLTSNTITIQSSYSSGLYQAIMEYQIIEYY